MMITYDDDYGTYEAFYLKKQSILPKSFLSPAYKCWCIVAFELKVVATIGQI